MNRLLTKREKSSSRHSRSKSSEPGTKSRPISSAGFFSLFKVPPDAKKEEKPDTKKVEHIKHKLRAHRITGLEDAQIEYALHTKYAVGDPDRAFDILVLFQESVEGIVRPYDPNIHMLGAENRGNVTCWLDSLLFAMFARLGSFEPILYTNFDDEPRRRLSTLIRLWVNMLRTGKLIQTDITQQLQESLASLGWAEGAALCQNDVSEAFSFITEKLCLPLLTMEMDIFHQGGADSDDHKFINERLLEVAVPPSLGENNVVRLEDCLEEHFNVRVDVVRRLGRRDTLQKVNSETPRASILSVVEEKEGSSEHIEDTEFGEPSPMTPISPMSPPSLGRRRANSILRRVVVPDDEASNSDVASVHGSMRKGSTMVEVNMKAWQFFRIIPWYTTDIPTTDAQVAAHFNSTRPVLGICLKRYSMSPDGHPVRLKTFVDIPLQIPLPHFIQDDKANDGGQLYGNFNLVLQSMVCHRGHSVHAGHYISIIRGTPKPKNESSPPRRRLSNDSELPEYSEDRWIKFDDLARERVTYVDIEKALVDEMPYLLFYQVQPIIEEEGPQIMPPAYEDSAIGMSIQEPTPLLSGNTDLSSNRSYFEGASDENQKSRVSFSDDADPGRSSLTLADSSRRGSLAFTDTSAASVNGASAPVTPAEERPSRLSRATSRFSRSGKSRSRPSSHVDESRISATFSRMNILGSKESINRLPDNSASDVLVSITSFDGSIDSVDTIQPPIAAPQVVGDADLKQKVSKIEKGKDKEKIKVTEVHPVHKEKGKEKEMDRIRAPEVHHIHKEKRKEKERIRDKRAAQDRECSLM